MMDYVCMHTQFRSRPRVVELVIILVPLWLTIKTCDIFGDEGGIARYLRKMVTIGQLGGVPARQ